jgi:succinoglycan biosynthesis protein ExoA
MTSQIPGLVSVLMPVRNEADSVEGAVASVLGQAYPSLELLVVDGRSDDATAAIVERLAAADPRIRLLDNPARGIATGLNVGLDAARGEFVARVDAHASVNDEYLALGVAHLLSAPDLAAVGGRRTGVAGTTTGRAIALALSSPFGVGNSINHYGTEVQPTDHASFGVYRASVARQVGGWDPALAVNEDVDFDFRILAAGYGIRYGKGAMVRKNGPSAVRPRHLAAPALVGTLALSGVAVLVRRPAVAVLLTAPYVVAVGAASIVTWRRAVAAGQSAGVDPGTLPGAFVAMHTGWGLGFLEGLAGRAPHATSKRDPAAVVS